MPDEQRHDLHPGAPEGGAAALAVDPPAAAGGALDGARARRPRTIRRRVLTGTAIAATIVVALALAGFAYTLDRILYTSAMSSTQSQAAQVAALLQQQDSDPETVFASVPTQGAELQLLDARGQVVLSTSTLMARTPLTGLRPSAGQTLHEQAAGIPQDAHDPHAVVAVGLDRTLGDGATTLLVASPLQFETMLVKGATGALAMLGIVLFAWLLWLINRVINSALRPVEQIRTSVAAIRTSDSDARVPVPAGDDEITALAQTMNQMLERLSRADAAQRAFVSNASHELRSPLTTLRAIGETSPDGLDAADTSVMVGEVVRMQRLVDDLLTLAKADDRGLALTRQEIDLDELVLGEVRRLQAATPLSVTADVEPARILGDELRLGQVLHNLTDNAARHARTTIRLASHLADGAATITVDNDGDPIAAGDRERVFDRFVRLQQSRDRDTGGSGLGLAIARAVALAHGGTLTTGETPEGWCRFTLTLPAPDADPGID